MKKLLVLILSLALVFSLSACKDDEVVEEVTFEVGMVTDLGGIDDKSFNQGTWEGVLKFAEEFNLPEDNYRYLQSASDADYLPNISAFADEELDLIIMPGFLFGDSLTEAAATYPAQQFLIIDMVVVADNVVVPGAIFSVPIIPSIYNKIRINPITERER